MNLLSKIVLITVCMPISCPLWAQSISDTTHISSKEEKNRNIMLNASDASKPREVSIGLPSSVGVRTFLRMGFRLFITFGLIWPTLIGVAVLHMKKVL